MYEEVVGRGGRNNDSETRETCGREMGEEGWAGSRRVGGQQAITKNKLSGGEVGRSRKV